MMLRKMFAHAAIIISGMYLVFFFIDRVNPAMSFIDNDITKVLLFALSLLSVINAICVIAQTRRELRRKIRRQEREARRQGR